MSMYAITVSQLPHELHPKVRLLLLVHSINQYFIGNVRTYVHMCSTLLSHGYFLHVLIVIFMCLVLATTVKVPINLEEAIVGACRMLELEPTLSFQSNVIQFIQLVQAHKMVSACPRSNPSYCCKVCSTACM